MQSWATARRAWAGTQQSAGESGRHPFTPGELQVTPGERINTSLQLTPSWPKETCS